MEKLKTNRAVFNLIPLAIMVDILSRLPTKTCLKCKLVCKEWYHMIISQEFADLRSSRPSYLTILLHGKFVSNRIDFLLLDLNKSSSKVDDKGNLTVSDDAMMMRFKSRLTIPHHNLYLVNECNGLICLESRKRGRPDMIICCSLLTGQQVAVGRFNKPSHCRVESFRLGCCPVTHQFKIVSFLKLKINGTNKRVTEIQTLGTNKGNNAWRTVGDTPVGLQTYHGIGVGVFLHGSFHKYSDRDNCIWSFNFGNEQFRQIPLADEMKGWPLSESIFDSCLCIFSCNENFQREIWLMKEYGVKDSWVKQFVIKTVASRPLAMPLLQIGTGEILFFLPSYFHDTLGACEIGSGSWKYVNINGQGCYKLLASFVPKFTKLLTIAG